MFQSLREKLGALVKKLSTEYKGLADEGESCRESGGTESGAQGAEARGAEGKGEGATAAAPARKAVKKAKAAARAAASSKGGTTSVIASSALSGEPFTEGLLGRRLREGRLDEILDELEMALLESDVALPVVEAIRKRVKDELVGRKVRLGVDIEGVVGDVLRSAISGVLSGELAPPSTRQSRFQPPYFSEFVEKKEKPVVIMFVGINGTGKTTTIAKIAHLLMKQGYSCVIGAADTFRAGAIEQLERHAERLGVKLVKHQPGSDPASVAFDAIEHARARKKDVVLIDTAGRMQTATGLMEEMGKIARVAKPDLIIYVGDALAGNDAVNEAVAFNKAVGIDAVVLTKIDADAKGGAALSIRYATGAPVIFVGTGQGYDDLQPFSPGWMVERIFGAGEGKAGA
ncbi:MAG: signal recognition particle-docking protein FtsY [Thermoplasmata archaeon]